MGFDYTKLTSGKFKLPSGWRVVTVQDVAVVNEQNIRKKYKHEIIEYIDVSSVEKGLVKTTKILPLRDAPSRARRIVRDQDILISTVRPSLQHYAFIKKSAPNTVASTGFAVVTAKQVEPRYLYYYLTSKPFTEYLTAIAESHTSAYPAFNPDVIEKAELLLPPNSEQRAIAHILGTLDDKIELNRQMNETLEAMAQAIFKSWFVDFDPVVVNAIKAGNPIPDKFAERAAYYRSNPDSLGLPDHILRLFPDRFVDSDLGPIPESWEVKTLNDVAEIHDNKRAPLNGRERAKRKGPYPYYGATGIMDYVDDYLFDGIYILIGEDGSVIDDGGHPITQYVWGKFWVNNHAHILSGKNGVPNEHLYIALQNANARPFITGAVQPKLSQKNLKALPLIFPAAEIVKKYSVITNVLFENIRMYVAQSCTLIALRDALLDKLISGEVKVMDIGKVDVDGIYPKMSKEGEEWESITKI